ncbi:MAG: glutamyl-tRNA reductase [Chloroflexi bacterium]|nr:glutamyl-tRNA reductase [Chloroflexota bacterium]
MKLVAVGLNHRTAPVAVRERFAFAQAQLVEALGVLPAYVAEGTILSTCNRTEVYAVADQAGEARARCLQFLVDFHGLSPGDVEPHVYAHENEDAARHLFRVAAGLDSMVLGEPQILGQVRQAYEAASRHECLGAILSSLFRSALHVGKLVRTETDIGRHAVSLSYAAVELARSIFGDLARCCVLVVGAGEMGKLTARTLVDCGAGAVLVANRTLARAEELAGRFGGQAVPFDDLSAALARADIVISSTDAPGFIIDAAQVRQAMARFRHNRPLFLVDIAVPRDVDPAVQQVSGVYLYNVDDLQAICEANRGERQREVRKVEALIDLEVGRFRHWWQTLEVLPTVADLRNHAERIRQAEVARALARLGPLTEREVFTIDAMSKAIVNKLLHVPTTRLKEQPATAHEYIHVLRYLFGLDEGRP